MANIQTVFYILEGKMKIPKKVKVGGITYKVSEVNCVESPNEDKSWGRITYSQSEIRILNKLEQKQKELTLIHELIHALFTHCNIEQDENKVKLISTALYMLIKDNPKLFN